MQDHRAALRETGEDDSLGGDALGALFIDESDDLVGGGVQLVFVDGPRWTEGKDVVPARHDPAAIDRHRLARRLGRMKRVLGRTICRASATGLKSVRSAPRPCSQMIQASAFGASRIRGSLTDGSRQGHMRSEWEDHSTTGAFPLASRPDCRRSCIRQFPADALAEGSAPGTPFVARRRRAAGCLCRCRSACGYSAATGPGSDRRGAGGSPRGGEGVANR